MTHARNTNLYDGYRDHHQRRNGQGGFNLNAHIEHHRRPTSAFVNPVTLDPLNNNSLLGARVPDSPQSEMVKEDTTPHIAHRPTEIFLFRMCACTTRAEYEGLRNVPNSHRLWQLLF